MTKYYTIEKAKFGGTTGTIIPFTIQMPVTNFPNFGDWDTLLPAGYLRCDGSIYQARLFPQLASIIGTGADCPFAKTNDLRSDSFQLPDLGSKWIRASTSSGQYLNDRLDQDSNILKVGTETTVETLVGDQVTINYSGSFNVIGQANKRFNGNPFYVAPDNDGNTAEDVLTEDNFQAHGHNADVGVFTYLGKWQDGRAADTGEQVDNEGAVEGSNNYVNIPSPEGATTVVRHSHEIVLPPSADLRNNTTLNYNFINTEVTPEGLQTTIDLSVNDVQKLDTAVSPYILVEYIIKI